MTRCALRQELLTATLAAEAATATISAGAVLQTIGKVGESRSLGDGHAFVVTNSRRIAYSTPVSDAPVPDPDPDDPDEFIKIIATPERLAEVERLMACGFEDDDPPHTDGRSIPRATLPPRARDRGGGATQARHKDRAQPRRRRRAKHDEL